MSVLAAVNNVTNAIAATATDPTREPWAIHDTEVLIVALLGIAIVVLLIVMLKMHAFLALTIGSLFVGVGSGIALDKVTMSYETGVGSVLGYDGVLIALGAMLGKLLADSGGADKVVDTLLRGRTSILPWKMALIAVIIGIPMFFEIGLVLLIPVVMLAVHRAKGPVMRLGIPALAGLSALHGFIPPHPGPLAASGMLHPKGPGWGEMNPWSTERPPGAARCDRDSACECWRDPRAGSPDRDSHGGHRGAAVRHPRGQDGPDRSRRSRPRGDCRVDGRPNSGGFG